MLRATRGVAAAATGCVAAGAVTVIRTVVVTMTTPLLLPDEAVGATPGGPLRAGMPSTGGVGTAPRVVEEGT